MIRVIFNLIKRLFVLIIGCSCFGIFSMMYIILGTTPGLTAVEMGISFAAMVSVGIMGVSLVVSALIGAEWLVRK